MRSDHLPHSRSPLAIACSATVAMYVAAAALTSTATAQITTLVQKPGLAGCIAITYDTPGPCSPGWALIGVHSIVISPDGANAYGAGIHEVAVFDRAADGALTQKAGTAGCIGDPQPGSGVTAGTCATGVGLSGIAGLAMSPDGKSLYVAATTADAVLVFDRAADGTLTQKAGLAGCVSNTGAGPCADGVGLDYVQSVTVSPDGQSVYAGGADSNAIAVFDRAADGSLTQKPGIAGCVSDTGAGRGPLRAALKVDIKEGRVSIVAILIDPPAYLHTAELAVIVLAVPGYGPKRVEKLMAEHLRAEDKTIGALSVRQRQALPAHFEH